MIETQAYIGIYAPKEAQMKTETDMHRRWNQQPTVRWYRLPDILADDPVRRELRHVRLHHFLKIGSVKRNDDDDGMGNPR